MKTPAIQLYTGDILKEGSFTCLSLAAQGLWMRMLLIMHDSCKRGFLLNAKGMQMSCKQLARIVGASESEVSALVLEMEDAGTFSRDSNSTIYNRRMVREEGGKASIHQVRSEAAKSRWNMQKACNGDARDECKVSANHAASSSSSSSASSSSSTSMQNAVDESPEDWPQTAAAIRETFPDASEIEKLANRIAISALDAQPELGDLEIAEAVRATRKRSQKSPGLWLQTVPAFLKNGAAKSREYHQPSCPICQDTWRVLRAGITEKPGWMELPESELYVPCECQKTAKEAAPVSEKVSA